jgi:Ca2+-binding EF-hand superfamily protein
MGGTYSTELRDEIMRDLSQVETQNLLRATHYSLDEIIQLRTQFLGDVPEGAVTPELFSNAALMFGIRSPQLVDMLFHAFDSNDDGLITFYEFARGMSIMTRGTSQERLQFAFDMYDVRREGVLRLEIVLSLLKGLEQTFGPFVAYDDVMNFSSGSASASGGGLGALEVANQMFAKGPIMSRDAFVEYALNNPSVVRGLALHSTQS